MLVDRLDEDAADAWRDGVGAATERWGDGAVDDLVLLRSLLERADDDLLKILGPHLRRVLVEIDVEEKALAESGAGRRVPFGDHLLEAALNEAIDLTGQANRIADVHLVLALFFFPGAHAALVLERCGIDWRPLRSLARRLTSRWYDW